MKKSTYFSNEKNATSIVQEGILLGYTVTKKIIEFDRVKIQVIEKMPPPSYVKRMQTVLGYAGFYKSFIKDFLRLISF